MFKGKINNFDRMLHWIGHKLLIIVFAYLFYRFNLCIITKSELSRKFIQFVGENSVHFFFENQNNFNGKIQYILTEFLHRENRLGDGKFNTFCL